MAGAEGCETNKVAYANDKLQKEIYKKCRRLGSGVLILFEGNINWFKRLKPVVCLL